MSRQAAFDPGKFFPLLPEHVTLARAHLQPLLEKFSQATCMVTPDEAVRQAATGECQLWAYHDEGFLGLAATRLYFDAVGKVCELWMCVGDGVDGLIDGSLKLLEAWAKDNGCYKTRLLGRKGWERRLAGYEQAGVVLDKKLVELN